jgi:hypothetical protein
LFDSPVTLAGAGSDEVVRAKAGRDAIAEPGDMICLAPVILQS